MGGRTESLRYNSALKQNRRVSLSQHPDENKQGIEDMVAATPNARAREKKQLLFV